MQQKQRVIFKWLLVVLLVSIMPVIPVQVVPEWKIKVVDEIGNPLVAETIVQGWKHYTYEFFLPFEHIDKLVTDDTGTVTFPQRRIFVTPLQMVLAGFRSAMSNFDLHSSYGPRSSLTCANYLRCIASYDGSGEPVDLIEVKTAN